jgi:hypothetical protein
MWIAFNAGLWAIVIIGYKIQDYKFRKTAVAGQMAMYKDNGYLRYCKIISIGKNSCTIMNLNLDIIRIPKSKLYPYIRIC